MSYIPYIIFGLAPSAIWLLFYLRKDAHPESNRMILKIFAYGMLATIPAALAEMGIFSVITNGQSQLTQWNFDSPFLFLLYGFLGVAFVEEFLKYLIVRGKVLNNPEFDEPVDAVLYMIIAALGFAALENIFYLFPVPGETPPIFLETITTSFIRFIGATFLHSLSSAVLGFFMALSFFNIKKKLNFTVLGLGLAILLHGVFNLLIIKIGESLVLEQPAKNLVIINFPVFIFSLIALIALLGGSIIFVLMGFRKIKKIASVCKIAPSRCKNMVNPTNNK